MRTSLIALLGLSAIVFAPAPAWAYAKDCPAKVNAAVLTVHHAAKITYCFEHKYQAGSIFEVKITTAEGKRLELHTQADGTIVADKEQIPNATVPKNVAGAFTTKYPGLHVKITWRDTPPAGPVKYEFVYSDEGGRHYAEFTEAGDFVFQSDEKDPPPTN